MSETNFTPAQLEAWAELGPFPETRQAEEACDFLFECGGEDRLQASLAAPDLARLVLEKEKEIARLKAGMATKQWPPSDAELREMLAVVVGAWWSESSAWRLRTRQLNPEDIKGMYAIRDVLAPYIARQARKGPTP